MVTISTFTKTNAGFSVSIQTAGLKAKVAITPVEKCGDSASDYRVFVGKVEIGAGWVRSSKGWSSIAQGWPRFFFAISSRHRIWALPA